MDLASLLKLLAIIQGGTLISIIVYGYKIIRFANNIEFKTDLMWLDYEKRMDMGNIYFHRRVGDQPPNSGSLNN